MSNPGTYLLIPEPFDLPAFQGVAYSMVLTQRGPATGTRGVDYCERWSGDDTIVEWHEVGKLHAYFVRFVSPDPKATIEYLRDKLGAVEASELVAFAGQPELDEVVLENVLYRIGYMTPEAGAEVLALFERSLTDPRPALRSAALNAYMIRRWPGLWDRVVELEKTDEDPAVRSVAARVLAHGPNASE